VLQSGLVVKDDPDKIEFKDVDAYLTFFKNTLVRASGSTYEKEIAKRYILSKPLPILRRCPF
jgi:hypothetical protein